jgi:hypothetical protein
VFVLNSLSRPDAAEIAVEVMVSSAVNVLGKNEELGDWLF